jgi:plasmid replication initiation protein
MDNTFQTELFENGSSISNTSEITSLIDPDKHVVYKSNRLIESCHKLTLPANKLLASIISQVDPTRPETADQEFQLSIKDLATALDCSTQNIYQSIETTTMELQSHVIRLVSEKDKKSFELINIFHKSKYDNTDKVASFVFHEDMKAEIVELSRYTKYLLGYTTKLKSNYSFCLYELARKHLNLNARFGDVKFWTIELSKLQFCLGIRNEKGDVEPSLKSYGSYKVFRTRILDKSIAEISEKTDILISYDVAKKVGNKVTQLRFKVSRNVPLGVNLSNSAHKALLSINYPDKAIVETVEACGEQTIIDEVKAIFKITSLKDIKNPQAFMNSRLQKALDRKVNDSSSKKSVASKITDAQDLDW